MSITGYVSSHFQPIQFIQKVEVVTYPWKSILHTMKFTTPQQCILVVLSNDGNFPKDCPKLIGHHSHINLAND